MPLLPTDAAAYKLLLVAAASAASSSLLTYAVFRWQRSSGSRNQSVQQQQQGDSTQGDGGDLSEELEPAAPADPFDPCPRLGYLSWDDYFMAVAFLSAQRSKDPNKQVGACIVDRNNVICGIGYNGFPRGCPDSKLPWAKKSRRGDPLDTKYPYVCHAEMNAILNKNGASVEGAKVFVTMFPCNECAKLMIQAGIREVVYHEGKDSQPPRSDSPLITASFNRDQQYAASRRLLALAGVSLRQHLFQKPVLLRLTNESRSPAALLRPSSSSSRGDAGSNGSGTAANGSVVAGGTAEEAAAAEAPASVAPAVAAALQNGGNHSGSLGAAQAAAAAAKAAHGRRRRGRRQTPQEAPAHEQQQ